jgi:hypothetical protein
MHINTFFAASLIDNPWVLVVTVLIGALSQWLMKRRQISQSDKSTTGEEAPPSPQNQDRSLRELDLQEALRQMLGGETPPLERQPPQSPPVMRKLQPAGGGPDEEQFRDQYTWADEQKQDFDPGPPPPIQAGAPSRPDPELGLANPTRVERSQLNEEAVRRFEELNEQGRHPATVINTARGRRSQAGSQGVALMRNARTVRSAFVTTIVFGPPKAFES